MNYYQYLTSSQLFSNELNDYHLCFESKYFECYVVRIFYDYFVHFCYSKKKKNWKFKSVFCAHDPYSMEI